MHRWPLLCAVLLGITMLLTPARHVLAATNSAPLAVNVAAHDFGVEWTTDQSLTASIIYGVSCASAISTGAEIDSNGYVHLADASNGTTPITITASTTYYYKLVDQVGNSQTIDDNGGRCYHVTTLPESTGIPSANSVIGLVHYLPDCTQPVLGALVTLTVTHGGIQSLPLAVTSSPSGGWFIVVGQATDASGNLLNPVAGDALNISIAAALGDAKTETASYNPNASPDGVQEVPDVCLAQPSGAPAGTVSPSSTATLTPTVTGTAPVATGTVVPSTVVSTATVTGTPPPTSTASPAGTASPVPTVTGTIVATLTPTTTPTITPTPLPTATLTPIPTAMGTATPTVTTTPTATPIAAPHVCTPSAGSTPRLVIRTRLSPKTVASGSTEHLLIVTHPGACLQVQVAYAGHGGSYRARGKTGLKSMWRHNWVVRGPRGYASVHITALFGGKRTTAYRHITVR